MEQLEAIVGSVKIFESAATAEALVPQSLPSPGVGIRHYAPRARVVPVELAGTGFDVWLTAIATMPGAPKRVGLMRPDGWPLPQNFSGTEFAWGKWEDDHELARKLFAGLRWLDDQAVDCILCPLPPPRGVGAAIRDRVLKAARQQ